MSADKLSYYALHRIKSGCHDNSLLSTFLENQVPGAI